MRIIIDDRGCGHLECLDGITSVRVFHEEDEPEPYGVLQVWRDEATATAYWFEVEHLEHNRDAVRCMGAVGCARFIVDGMY